MPELVRFYGCTPIEWLAVFPMLVVNACLRAIPRLEARESIAHATRVATGTGSIESASTYMRRWHAQGYPQRTPAREAKLTRGALRTVEEMRHAGIPVFRPTRNAAQ